MIVIFRNFFRNKAVNLTASSVRAFLPEAKFYCYSFYKHSKEEYAFQDLLNPYINVKYLATKYINPANKPLDDIDSTKTSGYQNADNVKYFVEGYNAIYQDFKDEKEKVLIIAEDHFFTNGATLKELVNNEFDLAYAPWDNLTDANASILCVRFANLKNIFPIQEYGPPIERHLQETLVYKVNLDKRYIIKNRKHADYFGDGMYTNSSAQIKDELVKAGIL